MKRILCTMAVGFCGAQILVAQPSEQEFRLRVPPGGEDGQELAFNEHRGPGAPAPGAPQLPKGVQPPRGPEGPRGMQPPPPDGPEAMGPGGRGGGMVFPPFEEPAKRTLFITSAKMETVARDALREDLNIMSRLLDKAVERTMESSGHERRMGIQLMALPGARGENIYVGDYGVIFVLNVPMSLTPPGKTGDEKGEETESDWEQTKRELYSSRPFGSPFGPEKYDARKVERLKTELLGALKNASNIRNIKGDQTVTVVVSGADTGGPFINTRVFQSRAGGKDREEKREEIVHVKGQAPNQSTLTIQARKSDIDALAKGKLTVEDFAKKASAAIY